MSNEGHCLCGRVSFRADGEPLWVAHCHCESYRRTTASPMTTYAGFRPTAVVWQGDVPTAYNSSPGVTRHFCGKCGTPLSFESERFPDEVHLFVANLNDPNTLAPQCHVFTEERISWMHLSDGLPEYSKTSQDEPKR